MPGGQINDPSSGKHYSLLFLPETPWSLSLTLEGLFELTRCPLRALVSPHALLPELQRHKVTVSCAMLAAKVPGHILSNGQKPHHAFVRKSNFCTMIHDF